jgi:DnaK suppressor protein
MTYLNQGELTEIGRLLDERERELRTDLEREAGEKRVYTELASEVPDPGDSSFANLALDLGHAEVSRDIIELRAIEAARARIEAGTYGICLTCQTEIPIERLKAQPIAERCTPCQEMHEKTHADAIRRVSM